MNIFGVTRIYLKVSVNYKYLDSSSIIGDLFFNFLGLSSNPYYLNTIGSINRKLNNSLT